MFDSPGYENPMESVFYTKIRITPSLTKSKNILTHWSVDQVGSKEEKNLEAENLVGLSLESTVQSMISSK